METKFEIGDKVKLKKGLKIGTYYGSIELLKSMRFDTIRTIMDVSRYGNFELIESPFYYSPEMLEKIK